MGTAITPSPLVMVTTLPFAFLIVNSSTSAWPVSVSAVSVSVSVSVLQFIDEGPDHGQNCLDSPNQSKHIDVHCSPR